MAEVDEDSLFNLDVVRDFIISKGGKSTNHELVTHFKSFLNDAKRKVANRQKFKEIVNTLAIVKLDENGEKVLQLKRKFRDGTGTDVKIVPSSTGKDLPKNRPKAKKAKLADQFESSVLSEAQTPSRGGLDFSQASSMEDPYHDESHVQRTDPNQSGEPSLSDMIAGALGSFSVSLPPEGVDMRGDGSDSGSTQKDLSPESEGISYGDVESIKTPSDATTPDDVDQQVVPEYEPPQPAPAPAPAVAPALAPVPVPEPPGRQEAPAPEVRPEAGGAAAAALDREPPWGGADTDSGVGFGSIPDDSASCSVVDSTDGLSLASSEGPVMLDVAASPAVSHKQNELEDSIISVKQRAQHLNRMESQSNVLEGATGKRKERHSKAAGAEDEDSSSETSITISLTDVDRKWMVDAAQANYQELAKALNNHPRLARYKDFTSTALHWAAKHGDLDIVKLLCGSKENIEVNAQTGYSSLHLASIQGHEDVIELLVQGYKADPDIRDHSGRKPKQYLKHSASTRSQQLLQPRRIRTSIVTKLHVVEIQEDQIQRLVASRYGAAPRDPDRSGGDTKTDQEEEEEGEDNAFEDEDGGDAEDVGNAEDRVERLILAGQEWGLDQSSRSDINLDRKQDDEVSAFCKDDDELILEQKLRTSEGGTSDSGKKTTADDVFIPTETTENNVNNQTKSTSKTEQSVTDTEARSGDVPVLRSEDSRKKHPLKRADTEAPSPSVGAPQPPELPLSRAPSADILSSSPPCVLPGMCYHGDDWASFVAGVPMTGTGQTTTFRRMGSYSSKIRSVGGAPFGIQGGAAMRKSWTEARSTEARSMTPSPSHESPQQSPGETRRQRIVPGQVDQEMMPPPRGVPLRRHRSRRGDSRENLSDSEVTANMPLPPRSGSDSELMIQTETGV